MNRAAVSSATLVSSKRSASAAGVDGGAKTSGSKRQRVRKMDTTQSLAEQAATYAAEKFSDSFSVSHVLNLLVRCENQYVHKAARSTDMGFQLTSCGSVGSTGRVPSSHQISTSSITSLLSSSSFSSSSDLDVASGDISLNSLGRTRLFCCTPQTLTGPLARRRLGSPSTQRTRFILVGLSWVGQQPL